MKEKLFTRNFTLLILGQVSSLIGNYSLKFALSMYILEQTGSASVFAGITAVSMLSSLCVLSASFLLPSVKSLTVIGLLLVILSVLGAFESPTVQACVPQMLAGDNILKGNAIVSQVQAVASLIAPFSGSIFYTAFGIRPVLYASAVCFFLTALLECFIRLEYIKSGHKSGIASVIKTDFSASMQFLFRVQTSVLKLLLLAALISMFLSGILMVGFPYLVRTVLGLSAEHYGAAESAMGIAAIAGSIAIGVAAGKLRTRYMTVLISVSGICLFPAGLIFITSASPFVNTSYCSLHFAAASLSVPCSPSTPFLLSSSERRNT